MNVSRPALEINSFSKHETIKHTNEQTMKTMQRHRTVHCALLAGLLGGLGGLNSHGQVTFDSGSDGSFGPMNITSNTTLALPPDGKFKCTTITVASDATLRFTPNALNTPVYLLATSNVTISGTIDVSGSLGTAVVGGAGGPGGFAGGNPGITGFPAGDGNGPGAGRGGLGFSSIPLTWVGSAGYGTVGLNHYESTNDGTTYGSPLLIPLVGGSGGGGTIDGDGGAGGGGAILIASNTRIDLPGTIVSSSTDRYSTWQRYGFGSGGAIRLAAPVVAGGGSLNVAGGRNSHFANFGGAGRIRIDCIDRRSLALTFTPSSVTSIGATMVAFLTNSPRLDITQAAGNNIPVGTDAPVFFILPQGSSTNQTVTVQASNFGAAVSIRVVLTPDNGPGSSYDAQIDNSAVNPASVTVPVVVPVNVQVQVNAWTR